jgi:hypothetical protein
MQGSHVEPLFRAPHNRQKTRKKGGEAQFHDLEAETRNFLQQTEARARPKAPFFPCL